MTPDSDLAPPTAMRTFGHILVNTAVANVTTSFLWFALTFWVYLGTRSVLATGVIGGAYMLFVSVSSIFFGTIVDHHRKLRVMQLSSVLTLLAFGVAAAMFMLLPESALLDISGPWFWAFTVIILAGAVVEQLRNIALSTTVTILVPDERRANANGLVGTVQGVAFMVTSVFSGLAIGLLGMGWTLAISLGLMAATLVHLFKIQFPEDTVAAAPAEGARAQIDLSGSIRVIRSAPGLFSLIIFATFNNLIGGVYMALMDPYGLELFSVEAWGIVLGVTATGFIIGGGAVAKFGLGANPMRTMLLVVIAMGVLGATFTIREWWVLYGLGIWVYMCLIPVVEAAEQTVIQRVVPLERQGRVFGFAMTFETAAAPITAFLIAPIAEFWVIPYAQSDAGAAALEPWLGTGDARGIALVFLISGLIMVAAGLVAFRLPVYRVLSRTYRESAPQRTDDGEAADVEPSQPSVRAGVAGAESSAAEARGTGRDGAS